MPETLRMGVFAGASLALVLLLPIISSAAVAPSSRHNSMSFGGRIGFLPVPSSKPLSRARYASSPGQQDREEVAKVVEGNIDDTVTFVEKASKALSREIRVPRFLSPRRPNDLSTDNNTASSTVKAWFVLATSLSFAFGNGLFFALSYVYLYLSRPADLPDAAAAIAAGVTAAILTPVLSALSHLLLLDNLDYVTVSTSRGVIGITVAMLALREAFKDTDLQGFVNFKEIVPPTDSESSLGLKNTTPAQRPKVGSSATTTISTTRINTSGKKEDAGGLKGRFTK